jgi:predicted enzyme related to lactoylglutathione lyase
MITHIATAAVYTDDQQKALEFWTARAGFEVHRQQHMTADASWIEVGPAGAQSCLVIYPRSMMPDWRERQPSIVFECDDLQATYTEMAKRSVRFTQPPHPLPWGPFALFEDPDGNTFGLRERAAR